MQHNPDKPILPVNRPSRGGKTRVRLNPVSLIMLIAVVVLAVLILKSALNREPIVSGGVREINSWGVVTNDAKTTAEPALRPTAVTSGMLPVFYKANTSQKKVAITVQGITSASDMDKLLGTCATYDAKLTFFIDGSEINSHPSLWPSVVLGGHEIESRGYSSSRISTMNDAELATHIDAFTDSLRAVIGSDWQPHFLRPNDLNEYDDVRLHRYLSDRHYLGIASWSLASPASESQIEPGQVICVNLNSYGADKLSKMISVLDGFGWKMVTLNSLFEYPENLISSENG